MTRTRTRPVVLAIAAGSLLTLSLSACSESTPAENEAAACEAIEELGSAVTDLEAALTPETSIDDLTAARERVVAADEAASTALDSVAADRVSAWEDAWEKLLASVSEIEGSSTVPQALDSVKEEASAVVEARTQLAADLKCS